MIKQVIVMRKDLGMRRGKENAQGSHASMAWLVKRMYGNGHPEPGDPERWIDLSDTYIYQTEWMISGQTKICVRVSSEEELFTIFNAAREAKLEVHMIRDAGATEFKGVPTNTCIAIGPNEATEIDKITGHLSLY